jgi:hypothetical protein
VEARVLRIEVQNLRKLGSERREIEGCGRKGLFTERKMDCTRELGWGVREEGGGG